MTKQEELEQFKAMLVKKSEKFAELSSPSKELDDLLEEFERDKITLRRLSREATLEHFSEKGSER